MARKKKLETALENLLTPPSENPAAVECAPLEVAEAPDAPDAPVVVDERAVDDRGVLDEPAAGDAPVEVLELLEVTALPNAPLADAVVETTPPAPESLAPPEDLEDGIETEVLAVDVAAVPVVTEEEEEAFPFADEMAAGRATEAEEAGTERQLVILMLVDEWYGVDIAAVEQIIELQRITPVPHTPSYIAGLTNLRGAVLPVVDLRRRLGLPLVDPTRETRIMVTQVHGMQVGMIVDAVTEVLRVPERAIEAPSPLVTPVDSMYMTGIAKVTDRGGERNAERLIVLLDLEQILPGVRGH